MKRVLLAISFVIVVGASFLTGYYSANVTVNDDLNNNGNTTSLDTLDDRVLEVYNELLQDHFSRPTTEQLLQGAIDGMIASLDDPFTSYFDAEEAASFTSSLGETYTGIGVTVRFSDGNIVVEEVKLDGPAYNAGIRVNDIIAFVDYEDIRDLAFYQVIGKVVGEEGTEVTIGLVRSGVDEIIHLTMERAVIDNSTVVFETFTVGTDTIGYIKVSTFGSQTFSKFYNAIADLETEGIDGLIVDLRDNGGGYLSTVYNMLNQFLIDNGQAMFTTESYVNGTLETNEYNATNKVRKPYEIVTLVNENSASASEVFASAMQEHGNYQVVGLQTYGKGTMQTEYYMDTKEGDSIHITIGKWLTSDYNWVHYDGGTDGVTPDIIIDRSVEFNAYKIFLGTDETIEYDSVNLKTANIQIILNAMGYTLRTDGYFDTQTQNAISMVQANNALVVSGTITQETLDIINAFIGDYQRDYANDTQLQTAITYIIDGLSD